MSLNRGFFGQSFTEVEASLWMAASELREREGNILFEISDLMRKISDIQDQIIDCQRIAYDLKSYTLKWLHCGITPGQVKENIEKYQQYEQQNNQLLLVCQGLRRQIRPLIRALGEVRQAIREAKSTVSQSEDRGGPSLGWLN